MRALFKLIYWTIIKLARSNAVFRVIIDISAYVFYRIFRNNKFFSFRKNRFKYFYHPYNRTIASERIIEIPVAKGLLNYFQAKNKKILEIGNVMAHYFSIDFDVLDKYEKGPGVINKDVVNFKLKEKYDLIFSVSTMEHVGWTYGEKKDPTKFLKGIANLKKHLKENGMLTVTFPLYYREDLSRLIINKKMPFNHEFFMVRTSFWNEWKEVDFRQAIKGNAYDKYFANANVLYIGFYSKSSPVFSSEEKLTNLTLFGRVKAFYSFVHAFFEYI